MDLENKTLLVVAPHPDDEVLGCGGLIHRIKKGNGKVYVIYMTNGDTVELSSKNNISSSSEKKRLSEIKRVAGFMKFDGWRIAFPGNENHLRLDSLPQHEIISNLEHETDISIHKIHPHIIALPQSDDYNQDHRATALAVLTACRPSPHTSKNNLEALLGYEFTGNVVWGLYPKLPQNVSVVLQKTDINHKISAMKLYSSQVREKSHTRSLDNIKNLARVRGAASGTEFAESFYGYRLTFK